MCTYFNEYISIISMFFILHKCIRAPDTYVIKADIFKVKNYCFLLT